MKRAHRPAWRALAGIAGLILVVVASSALAAKGQPGDFRRAATSPEEVGGLTAWGSRIIATNLDGAPGTDLAVIDSTSSIAILSGKRAGNFTEIGTEAVGANPIQIAAGNFDGENGTDLAVATDAGPVTILLNDGSGDFSEPGTSPEVTEGGGVTSADFDGDEDIDLVAGSSQGPGQGTVLLNDGSGDFAAGDAFFSDSAELLESADLDDDGDRDVVQLYGPAEGAFALFNDGDGNFGDSVAVGFSEQGNAYGIAVGRIGRGKSPDIALAANDGIYLFLNDGDGGFDLAPRSPLRRSRRFGGLRIADVDRDGKGDIVAGELLEHGTGGPGMAVFLSRRGRFKEPRTSPERVSPGGYFPWLATGKFDRRQGLDVAAAVEGAVSILLNRSPRP